MKANPLIELNKALKLLQILPELIKLNTGSIGVVYNSEHEKIKLSNNKTVVQIDAILTIIEQANIAPELKQESIDKINKIKSLLLL